MPCTFLSSHINRKDQLTNTSPSQLICLQPPSETAVTNENTCDSATLAYTCECGDGISPNLTQFSQTMPFFICQEWGNQCVTACNGDNACSSACREDHPCGAQDPVKPNSSTISSTMSTSASGSRTAGEAGATTDSSGGTIYSGFGGASSTGDSSSAQETSGSSSSSAGRAAALQFGQTFGVLALAGAFFGGFALML